MIKKIIVHGREATQCTCDKCKRVIYMKYEKYTLIKQLKSYTKGKVLYKDLNKEMANVYDLWIGMSHQGSYCKSCLSSKLDELIEPGDVMIDVNDNLERCFYTEIPERKLKLNVMFYDKYIDTTMQEDKE